MIEPYFQLGDIKLVQWSIDSAKNIVGIAGFRVHIQQPRYDFAALRMLLHVVQRLQTISGVVIRRELVEIDQRTIRHT